ncbi:aminopeptidase [Alphaproteobacteria bacterium]|nr:aminopeptidase [Alphaproteobacteria bacterium]
MSEFKINENKIDKLANLAVKRGVGLQKGQNLLITAPIESLPLVRKIAEYAYKEGASIVTPLFTDSDITLSRFKYAPDESFDSATDWLFNGMGEAFDNNTARMAIAGDDPMLLSQMDPDKVSRANKAMAKAYKPARERITEFKINWNIVSWPGSAWASRVFPELPLDQAIVKLADAIFDASRASVDDPIQAWDDHNEKLRIKTNWLNEKNFAALQYNGPNTNLRVGLADEHEWMGGASKAQNGITCNPNIPSEEVFTTPHAYKVDGTVSSTKPLSYQGTLIDDIKVTFKEGKIIEAHASKGEQVLQKVLKSDEGASRIGGLLGTQVCGKEEIVGTKCQDIAVVYGTIGGAAIGTVAQGILGNHDGFQYIVDIDNDEKDSAFVQGDKTPISKGQRVVIIYGNDIRVLPYEE